MKAPTPDKSLAETMAFLAHLAALSTEELLHTRRLTARTLDVIDALLADRGVELEAKGEG